MRNVFKSLFFPLLSLSLLTLGNAFFITFVSVRLDLEGASNEMIGIVAAAFYSGIVIASIFMPSIINRYGHLRIWILFCFINAFVILFHAAWINVYYWLILRLLCGILLGGFFVLIESWILLLCPSVHRSFVLSIYLLIYYIATSAGQLFLDVCSPYSLCSYFIPSGFFVLAILPCVFCKRQVLNHENFEKFSLIELVRMSYRGFSGGFIAGMLLASIYGLVPVYGQRIGFTVSEIGTMMSIMIFGGLSLQLPLGKLADSTNRKKVMIYSCFATTLFSLSIAFFNMNFGILNLVLFWLFGGFAFSLYPLSLAFTCEKVSDNQIVALTGGFNLTYGLGAVVGPLFSPLFMNWIGPAGLFYFMSALCFIMGSIMFTIKNSPVEK